MPDRLEYGCRWLSGSGEIAIAKGDSSDPREVQEFVDAMREVQRRGGRVPDAHLIARRLDTDGFPIDDWHAVRPPETTNA
ncbi:hypothetical protein [Nocardia otitidiscaviarum]|uniref:hypothetical protein n=1 Tax=Nocardia otitidiscaviarum TaxID=1823 RepID=UPI0004A6BF71|nr:hypothetical protein [Nocardia otitidiscaviarum]